MMVKTSSSKNTSVTHAKLDVEVYMKGAFCGVKTVFVARDIQHARAWVDHSLTLLLLVLCCYFDC